MSPHPIAPCSCMPQHDNKCADYCRNRCGKSIQNDTHVWVTTIATKLQSDVNTTNMVNLFNHFKFLHRLRKHKQSIACTSSAWTHKVRTNHILVCFVRPASIYSRDQGLDPCKQPPKMFACCLVEWEAMAHKVMKAFPGPLSVTHD